MNRYGTMMFAVVLVGACALPAQDANPLSTEAKQAYTAIKNNMMKMAEKMPEENYDFKPTPDIRTFGALVAHVQDVQQFHGL